MEPFYQACKIGTYTECTVTVALLLLNPGTNSKIFGTHSNCQTRTYTVFYMFYELQHCSTPTIGPRYEDIEFWYTHQLHSTRRQIVLVHACIVRYNIVGRRLVVQIMKQNSFGTYLIYAMQEVGKS
jgi:hypothetical protein